MKTYGHGASFEALLNPLLEDIAGFRVDYCQLRNIPDANWISDSYLAFARILPWVYGIYCLNFKPPRDKEEEFTQELRLMQQLINAYYVMISALMHRPEDTNESHESFQRRVGIIEQKVKVFLTICSLLSEKIDDDFWQQRGNFYSLL